MNYNVFVGTLNHALSI